MPSYHYYNKATSPDGSQPSRSPPNPNTPILSSSATNTGNETLGHFSKIAKQSDKDTPRSASDAPDNSHLSGSPPCQDPVVVPARRSPYEYRAPYILSRFMTVDVSGSKSPFPLEDRMAVKDGFVKDKEDMFERKMKEAEAAERRHLHINHEDDDNRAENGHEK